MITNEPISATENESESKTCVQQTGRIPSAQRSTNKKKITRFTFKVEASVVGRGFIQI